MPSKPFLEELIHLTSLFLSSNGHKELAEQLQETYELPEWIEQGNPLFKKGLVKIIKEYTKTNEKIAKYYANRTAPEEEEVEEEEEVKVKVKKSKRKNSNESFTKVVSPRIQTRSVSPKLVAKPSPKVQAKAGGSSWMSKFEQPKRLEQIHGVPKFEKEEVIHVETKTKTSKKEKKKAISSSDYESEEDSFELEPKKKQKKQVKEEKKAEKVKEPVKEVKKEKKQKKPAKIQTEEQQEQEEVKKPEPMVEEVQVKGVYDYNNNNNNKGPRKFFSRINVEEVGPIAEELKDNSFHAKGRYGQAADEWGQFGYDKLKDTRGDSFKKTKGKLKNRAFQGALMDINKINSIPIN